jgi:hypothetical protein
VNAAVVPPIHRSGGPPRAHWRADVGPTVLAMAAEMAPDELTARAVARRMGLQDPQIWRALPGGRADILFIVACDLQIRQAEAVATPAMPRRRTAPARVAAHLDRMLAFDFAPGTRPWRRACAAQSWYWTRDQQRAMGVDLPSPFRPVEKDAGGAIAAVMALYEATFRDACVMEWTLEQASMELHDRLRTIGLAEAPHHRPVPGSSGAVRGV